MLRHRGDSSCSRDFRMSTQAGLLSVEEFLKLPDPKGGYYELRHGEAVFVPFPKWGHTTTQHDVAMLLKRLVGVQGIAGAGMPFQPKPEYELWKADVAYVPAARADAVGDDEYLQGAPDLVVEVIETADTQLDLNDRMFTCLENGCSSFWVVDQKRKRLSVTEGNVTRHYGIDDSF